MGTPPVRSNLCASLIVLSTAVRNSHKDRIRRISCWNMQQKTVQLSMGAHIHFPLLICPEWALGPTLSKKLTWCLTSTETTRIIRDGEKGGRGYGGGGRGRLYTYRYTVTTRMTSALRWAAMKAILMLHSLWGTKSLRQCPQTTTFQEKGEEKRIRT